MIRLFFWAAVLFFAEHISAASEKVSPDAKRIIANIMSSRDRETVDGRNAAERLNVKADKEYRLKNYFSAYTAYSNSFPNFPNAYAYLMSGDSHWRAIVQSSTKFAPDERRCNLPNVDFSYHLDLDVSQLYEVGLILATMNNEIALLNSVLYHRASEAAGCLRQLANFYAAQPPTCCVDLDRISNCLGEPLIR